MLEGRTRFVIMIREVERGIEEERLASDVGHPGGGHVKLALGWERIHEAIQIGTGRISVWGRRWRSR